MAGVALLRSPSLLLPRPCFWRRPGSSGSFTDPYPMYVYVGEKAPMVNPPSSVLKTQVLHGATTKQLLERESITGVDPGGECKEIFIDIALAWQLPLVPFNRKPGGLVRQVAEETHAQMGLP